MEPAKSRYNPGMLPPVKIQWDFVHYCHYRVQILQKAHTHLLPPTPCRSAYDLTRARAHMRPTPRPATATRCPHTTTINVIQMRMRANTRAKDFKSQMHVIHKVITLLSFAVGGVVARRLQPCSLAGRCAHVYRT